MVNIIECRINDQFVLYVKTNGVNLSHGESNLHNDFKIEVLMINCSFYLLLVLLFYFYIYEGQMKRNVIK